MALCPGSLKNLNRPHAWVNSKYPPLARQARVEGSLQIKFLVDAEGRVTEIETEGHPLLKPAIEEDIRISRFDVSQCGGKSVEVSYQFAIGPEGTTTDNLTFRPPNRFVLLGHPPEVWKEVYLRPVRPNWLKRLVCRRC